MFVKKYLFLNKREFTVYHSRLRLKCDGTRAETTFILFAKWTIPFKSAGGGVSSVDYWQPRCAHQR